MAKMLTNDAKLAHAGRLTQKMERFVEVYLKTRNATEAYQQSYSPNTSRNTANREGSRLLKHPTVASAIEAAVAVAAARLGVNAQNTLKELARIAFSDPRRFFNEDGTLKGMLEMDDDIAATIASVDIEELFAGSGKDRIWTGYTKKLRFWNKNEALITLAKHLKLLTEAEDDPDAPGKGVVGIPADTSTEDWLKKYGNPSGRPS